MKKSYLVILQLLAVFNIEAESKEDAESIAIQRFKEFEVDENLLIKIKENERFG